MPDINGGYDKPTHAGATRFGRNKEITDEWTLLQQAHAATARARKSTKDGAMRPAIGNGTAAPKATKPGLSV